MKHRRGLLDYAKVLGYELVRVTSEGHLVFRLPNTMTPLVTCSGHEGKRAMLNARVTLERFARNAVPVPA